MRDALNKTGRPVYYSVTQSVPWPDGHSAMRCYGPGAVFTINGWLKSGKDPTKLANSYLIEYCNNMDFFGYTGGIPRPGGFLSNLDSQALLTYDNMTAPGAFSDNDMLQICNGGQSQQEYRAQFATWAVLTSPLILGNDLTQMDDACRKIVLNKEIIAISQDPRVSRGKLVYQWPDAVWPNHTTIETSAPAQILSLVLAPCNKTDDTQQFRYDITDGTLTAQASGTCVTYFGYSEANTGLAPCAIPTPWVAPGVGGQAWNYSDGTLYNHGNVGKALDLYNCDVDGKSAVQTCSFGSADCYASRQCANRNLKWDLDALGTTTTVATAVNDGDSCLAARQLPHSPMNISMQVWMKPLEDGSVAVVAFNRGSEAMNVTVPWWMLSLATSQTCAVRDLWQHQDLGRYLHQVVLEVGAHDARALKVNQCFSSH